MAVLSKFLVVGAVSALTLKNRQSHIPEMPGDGLNVPPEFESTDFHIPEECKEAVTANPTCSANPTVTACLGGDMDACGEIEDGPPAAVEEACATPEIQAACDPDMDEMDYDYESDEDYDPAMYGSDDSDMTDDTVYDDADGDDAEYDPAAMGSDDADADADYDPAAMGSDDDAAAVAAAAATMPPSDDATAPTTVDASTMPATTEFSMVKRVVRGMQRFAKDEQAALKNSVASAPAAAPVDPAVTVAPTTATTATTPFTEDPKLQAPGTEDAYPYHPYQAHMPYTHDPYHHQEQPYYPYHHDGATYDTDKDGMPDYVDPNDYHYDDNHNYDPAHPDDYYHDPHYYSSDMNHDGKPDYHYPAHHYGQDGYDPHYYGYGANDTTNETYHHYPTYYDVDGDWIPNSYDPVYGSNPEGDYDADEIHDDLDHDDYHDTDVEDAFHVPADCEAAVKASTTLDDDNHTCMEDQLVHSCLAGNWESCHTIEKEPWKVSQACHNDDKIVEACGNKESTIGDLDASVEPVDTFGTNNSTTLENPPQDIAFLSRRN